MAIRSDAELRAQHRRLTQVVHEQAAACHALTEVMTRATVAADRIARRIASLDSELAQARKSRA